MIFIDTEFNRNIEILSLGITSHKTEVKEYYFKNDPRDKSFETHGLSFRFLKENGLEPKKAKEIFTSIEANTIVGFDIETDLNALSLNPAKLFEKEKIIDLKLIISLFGLNPSLETFAISSGIMDSHKSLLPIHTASMDSLLLNKVFFIVFDFLIENGFHEDEIINDFKRISKIKFFREEWLYYDFEKKYKALNILFESLKLDIKKVLRLDFSKMFFSFENNVICLYDKNEVMFAKYKETDFVKNILEEFKEIPMNHKYSDVGFKHINLERILHGRFI